MYAQICVSLRTVSHSEDISWARRWWWERPLSLLSLKTIVIRDLTNLVTLPLMMVPQTPLQICLGALHQYTATMPTKQAARYLVQMQYLWTVLWKTAGFWFAFNIADASQLWIKDLLPRITVFSLPIDWNVTYKLTNQIISQRPDSFHFYMCVKSFWN